MVRNPYFEKGCGIFQERQTLDLQRDQSSWEKVQNVFNSVKGGILV